MTFKQISIENSLYYFYSDIINIKNFDSNSLSIKKYYPKILMLLLIILHILQ